MDQPLTSEFVLLVTSVGKGMTLYLIIAFAMKNTLDLPPLFRMTAPPLRIRWGSLTPVPPSM